MSKETKEEIMRGFAAMSPEMQRGVAIGLAAGIEAGKMTTREADRANKAE